MPAYYVPASVLPSGSVSIPGRVPYREMRLIIEHSDPEAVRILQEEFQSHPYLEARPQRPFQPGVSPGVNAFYLPMHAFEQIPSVRLLIHQAHVFRTRQVFFTGPRDLTRGWPPFLIAGITVRPGENAFDPGLVPLTIRAVIAAARRFNAQGHEVIEAIGVESGFTQIDKLAPREAARLIRAANDEAMAVAEEKLDEYGRVRPHLIAMVDLLTTTGRKISTEWRCLLEFKGRRCKCALILEELPRLGIGENEGVPIEFLCPETDRPQLKVGDEFTLWEGKKRIAKGVVRQVLPEA